MSLAIKYETVDDARMRLRHTVVLYKGDPVYVSDVARSDNADDIFRVTFQELPIVGYKPRDPFAEAPDGNAAKRKFISSKFFDIAPFKMGYVNRKEGKGAFYCSRLPNRVQKQGLCSENFQGKDNYNGLVDFNTFLTCPETLNMIRGNYPSFNVALAALAKTDSVAFCSEFCLVKDQVIPNLIFLYHKGVKVGMYTKESEKVHLGLKFNCLKESLQEMKIKVGAI